MKQWKEVTDKAKQKQKKSSPIYLCCTHASKNFYCFVVRLFNFSGQAGIVRWLIFIFFNSFIFHLLVALERTHLILLWSLSLLCLWFHMHGGQNRGKQIDKGKEGLNNSRKGIHIYAQVSMHKFLSASLASASLAIASLASKTKIRVNCVVPLFKEENLGIASQVQNSIKLKKFNRNCAIKYIKHIIPASCSLPQVLEDTFTQTLSKAEYLQHIKK